MKTILTIMALFLASHFITGCNATYISTDTTDSYNDNSTTDAQGVTRIDCNTTTLAEVSGVLEGVEVDEEENKTLIVQTTDDGATVNVTEECEK